MFRLDLFVAAFLLYGCDDPSGPAAFPGTRTDRGATLLEADVLADEDVGAVSEMGFCQRFPARC